MKHKTPIYALFFSLLKIGLFTFGGGYAMIALLENEFVSKKKWIEKDEFLDMVAIAESTPGPIAINAATYIGYQTAGAMGSILATIAVCIPSFLIIFAISLFFDQFLSLTLVANAFRGIQACVVYLIFSAALKMMNNMKKTPLRIAMLAAVSICMVLCSLFAVRFSTVFYVLICGAIGVFLYLLNIIRNRGKTEVKK